MLTLRKSADRGHFHHGWLDTYHTFSFADYYDSQHMGFGSLRVINEDRVAPGAGFPAHGHRDMEILTYVLEGGLQHRDSMGNGSVIRPGQMQRMSAGTGVTHSEFNASRTEPVHLLQIWILPEHQGLEPSYEEKSFSDKELRGALWLVASPDARNGSVKIHQDAELYAARLDPGQEVAHALRRGRHAWVQVTEGSMKVNGQLLGQGDAAALRSESAVQLAAVDGAEVLLFDLA